MMPSPVVHLPDDLPPKTAMALFELLNDLADALWQHYETELVELIMDELNADSASQQTFDFDDDLSF